MVSVCFKKQRRNKMATSKERDVEHRKGHLAMNTPPILSTQEWEAAREQLLVKEKDLTRARDALAAERRRMPRLLHGGRPGRPCRPSERPRHHPRVRLARATDGHRAREGTDGLGDAVVHHNRRFRH